MGRFLMILLKAEKMAFYDPEGRKLNSIDDFVNIYVKGYFLGNAKVNGFRYNQASRFVEEDVIIPILNGHISSYTDFAKLWLGK